MRDHPPALRHLNDRLRSQIARHRVPGASVAVVHRGNVYKASAGYASLPGRVEAYADTVFDIGSITKVYTTTLMMMLVDEGLVAIDDPVAKYLPDLLIDHRPVPDAVTLRTLLNHTSGIDGDFYPETVPGEAGLADFVRLCADLPYLHPVGQFRAYSNTGFCIVGRIAEVVTGKAFDALLSEKILRPLGTERFGFSNDELMRYRRAVGHRWDAQTNSFSVPPILRLPESQSPSGSVLAMSAEDLLRLGQLHLNDGIAQDGARLLSTARVAEMQAIHGEVPPSKSLLRLGWTSPKSSEVFLVSHGGKTIEQTAFLGILPAQSFGIAILTNSGDGASRIWMDLGAALVDELFGIVLPQSAAVVPSHITPGESDLATIDPERLVGRYRAATGQLDIAVDGRFLRGHLKYDDLSTHQRTRDESLCLVPMGNDKFAAIMDAPSQLRHVCEFASEGGVAGPFTYLFVAGRVFRRVGAGQR